MATADLKLPISGQFETQVNARQVLTPAGGSATYTYELRDELPQDNIRVFQTAELIAFRACVDLGVATSGVVQVALITGSESFDSDSDIDDEVLGASPESQVAYLSPQTPVRVEVSLPRGHVYGRELKGAVLGTYPPVLVVKVTGLPAGTTPIGFVSHSTVINCRGVAPSFRVTI